MSQCAWIFDVPEGKHNGIIKGHRCADGQKQQVWTRKEDASSPTAATESVLLMSVVEAKEH